MPSESAEMRAIAHVRDVSEASAPMWRQQAFEQMKRAGLGVDVLDELLRSIRQQGRVVIHFHPERLASNGRTVAQGLLESGIYKTQWETGISTGSPTAYVGGERHGWEERLFGGAYEVAPPASRPRYGALRLLAHPDGPAPRFGSCQLVLAGSVIERSTFTFPGSQAPEAVDQTAPFDRLEPVVVPLLAAIERDGGGLGVDGLTVEDFVRRASEVVADDRKGGVSRPLGRALDSFVEAQIHGSISLRHDVEQLVADSVFRDTEIGDSLDRICTTWGIELRWHPGYRLRLADVPESFRGWRTARLAARIEPVPGGWIDAAKIGAAANDWERNPERWPEFTSRDDALTAFRRIWHVLVQRAEPIC